MQSDERASIQEATRAWIRHVMSVKGWTATRLAKEAGLSSATLHRALNEDRFVTSTNTLERIASAAHLPSPMRAAQCAPPAGLREPEAVFIAEMHHEGLPRTQGQWRVNTRAVELAGYLPGDLVTFDQAVEPRAGDLVCAQIYNLQNDTAETVLRIYEPPYIVAKTMDPAVPTRPLPVDDERVKIWGSAVKMVRERR